MQRKPLALGTLELLCVMLRVWGFCLGLGLEGRGILELLELGV